MNDLMGLSKEDVEFLQLARQRSLKVRFPDGRIDEVCPVCRHAYLREPGQEGKPCKYCVKEGRK